jgi:hypothetical protein
VFDLRLYHRMRQRLLLLEPVEQVVVHLGIGGQDTAAVRHLLRLLLRRAKLDKGPGEIRVLAAL